MAVVEAQLQFYENALTNVEIELVQNALHDRFEHDLLRERVASSRWAEGEALLTEIERKHRALLVRRRIALEKLSDRASHTQQQVARRLGIIDEEYGFIRTHIFWVRDQDAIGVATLTQGAREFNHVVKGLIWLVQEVLKPNLWGQPSAEFMVTALAVLALPPAIWRLRRLLRGMIERGLPASLG
jgi:potassium efflux system protein